MAYNNYYSISLLKKLFYMPNLRIITVEDLENLYMLMLHNFRPAYSLVSCRSPQLLQLSFFICIYSNRYQLSAR